jgi:hypothetical protein
MRECLLQYENPDFGYYTVPRWNKTVLGERANDDARFGLADYYYTMSRLYELKST